MVDPTTLGGEGSFGGAGGGAFSVGAAPTTSNPVGAPVLNGGEKSLEERVALLEWFCAEHDQQIKRTATALATMMSQMVQPQMERTIFSQLLGKQV